MSVPIVRLTPLLCPINRQPWANNQIPKQPPTPKPSNTQTTVEEVPTVKRKQLYLVPKREELPDVVPLLAKVEREISEWTLHHKELGVKFKLAEMKKAAERQDEEVLELLLLAA